jgi:hypothetical protein
MFNFLKRKAKEEKICKAPFYAECLVPVYVHFVGEESNNYLKFVFTFPENTKFRKHEQYFQKNGKLGQWLLKKRNMKIQMNVIYYKTELIDEKLGTITPINIIMSSAPTMIESKLRCKKCGRFWIPTKKCNCSPFILRKIYIKKRWDFS